MAGSQGVPCPECRMPLNALLDTHVGVRLTRLKDGFYGLGAVSTYPSVLRHHLLHEHGDGRRLELDEEGIVVVCPSQECEYIGTLTVDGLETEEDRRAERAERAQDDR
jgi:hypothetical protein